MTQYRSLDFHTEADAAAFNRHMKSVADRGPRTGFRVVPGSSGYLSIEAGVLFTREGVRIEETATLTDELAITPPAAGMTRIDRIVCGHTYVATYPNVAANYAIVPGAEVADAADAVPPAEPADAETLALATISDEATDYDTIVPTARPGEGRKVFTLGDGENAVGDFNGWAGWVDLVETYRDEAIEVIVLGGIVGAGTFVVPSCWRVRGLAGAILGGAGDPIVAFEHRARSGNTNAGTAQLDDSGGEFSSLSTSAVIMIQTGPDAGSYFIGARTSDSRLVLVNPDGSTPSFTGGGCNYLALGRTPEVWDLLIVQTAAGGRGIDWSYTGGGYGRNIVVAASGAAIDEGFYTAISNFLVLDHCRTEGSMTDALKDGGYSANARVSHFQAPAGNVTWVTAGAQLDDIHVAGTVSAGGPTGSGGIGWPFATAHNADGTQADDSVPTAAIVDEAVTTDKIADAAVDKDKLNSDVAGDGLSGGAGSALAVNVDDSTIEIDADTLRVKEDGILPKHLGARSLWLVASFSTNTSANAANGGPIATDLQKNQAGTDQTVDYLGGSAFGLSVVTHYPWQVRKDATGVYQVRPSAFITGGGVVEPKYDNTTVVMSIIPIGAQRMFSMDWDGTGKFWVIEFEGHDGAAVDCGFQVMYFATEPD